MKITLNSAQVEEALKLYAILITGLDLKKATIQYYDAYNAAVSTKQATLILTTADSPSVPMPSKGLNKQVTQEQIDKVYSSVVDRKLDVS